MELRTLARRILDRPDLGSKLEPPPPRLTDDRPGPPRRPAGPARTPDLAISPSAEARVPAIGGLADPAQRPRIVHALANHELQAVELFAYALLAFPDAPARFRRGLALVLADEQRHTRLYEGLLHRDGFRLGDFPVSGFFWSKVRDLTSPLRFICAMGLTFENANLDFTLEYAGAARDAGDPELASVLERVHRDEIHHVRFGWTWLERLKPPATSAWEAYRANLTWPVRAELARGRTFRPGPRRRAGLDEAFIAELGACDEHPHPARSPRRGS